MTACFESSWQSGFSGRVLNHCTMRWLKSPLLSPSRCCGVCWENFSVGLEFSSFQRRRKVRVGFELVLTEFGRSYLWLVRCAPREEEDGENEGEEGVISHFHDLSVVLLSSTRGDCNLFVSILSVSCQYLSLSLPQHALCWFEWSRCWGKVKCWFLLSERRVQFLVQNFAIMILILSFNFPSAIVIVFHNAEWLYFNFRRASNGMNDCECLTHVFFRLNGMLRIVFLC